MNRRGVPDWSIQVAWWFSGIFATGALWYFLSLGSYVYATAAACGAVAFAVLAVQLHRKKDEASNQSEPNSQTDAAAAPEEFAQRYTDQPSHVRFIRALPKLRTVVYEMAHEGWDTGVTADMREASYDVIDFLEFAWLRLAEFYPPEHFGEKDSRAFIRDHIRERFRFHWAKHEPHGPGSGGTIAGVLIGGDVITDLERMISDTVLALFAYDNGFNYKTWLSQWQNEAPRPETE
jgi:hypothetical protein